MGFPSKEMYPVYFTVQKEGLMTRLYISQEKGYLRNVRLVVKH